MSEICPRCGQIGTRFVREIYGRKYVYYRHYDSESKKVRYCYIGPLEGYQHVDSLHGLRLTNIIDQDYIDVAILSILRATERLARESKEDYEKALEIVLERLFKRIERHRKSIVAAYKRVFSQSQ